MSQNQWTQHFFIDEHLSKVILTDNLTIQNHFGDHFVYLDFQASFSCHYDLYQNLTSLTIQSNRTVTLSHDNPTVLEQWSELLSLKIHKTNFYLDFEPGTKIGEGLSASVHTAFRKTTKKKVAVKVFPKSVIEKSELQALGFQNEVEILKLLQGGYFPAFVATYLTDKSYYLVYDWCQGVDLKAWVLKGSSSKEILRIANELVKALKQLKQKGVVHRDIKPQNVIYDPATKSIKIVDLGFATLHSNHRHLFPNCGTPGYAAPELLDKTNPIISHYVDVFSLGVTLYFLFFKKLPYLEDAKSLLSHNKECRFKFDNNLMQRQRLYDFIRRTVCPLKYRLSLQQLQSHPFLREEESRHLSSFFRNEINSKLEGEDDLDLLNKKIEEKRKERNRRQRILSMRTKSKLKRKLSRQKSLIKVNPYRFITENV